MKLQKKIVKYSTTVVSDSMKAQLLEAMTQIL